MSGLSVRPRQRASVCACCDRTFDPGAWSGLRLVRRLHRDELRDIVSQWPWPNDAHLEVRECRCGATITRLVSTPAA